MFDELFEKTSKVNIGIESVVDKIVKDVQKSGKKTVSFSWIKKMVSKYSGTHFEYRDMELVADEAMSRLRELGIGIGKKISPRVIGGQDLESFAKDVGDQIITNLGGKKRIPVQDVADQTEKNFPRNVFHGTELGDEAYGEVLYYLGSKGINIIY